MCAWSVKFVHTTREGNKYACWLNDQKKKCNITQMRSVADQRENFIFILLLISLFQYDVYDIVRNYVV